VLFSIVALIFFIFGILTPIYHTILKGKLSNETAFIITWVTTPHLVSYFYYMTIFEFLTIIISYILNLLLIYFNKKRYIINGSTLLIVGIIIALFNNLI